MARAPTRPRQPGVGISPDASQGYVAPPYAADMVWRSVGSSGLRQYSGWVREEFLPQLVGRQAARTFREMQDNSPTVGAIIFAIQQSMRQVAWRVEAPDDRPESVEAAEFVESCMEDMSQTWPDFIAESLSMLPYGFAPHEIVYKRRKGKQKQNPQGTAPKSSRFDDGKIGWAKLALRGQDTVLKWFFDDEGDITGMTQQPWFGGLIDIPIQKLLLFRPRAHKNNPEGYSILRTAYRPWWFAKRLEEMEAISLERMGGMPEYRVPNALIEAAQAGDAQAQTAIAQLKRIVTNVKIDEQMGLLTPSDTFMNPDGTPSSIPMYEFRYVVPQGRSSANFDPSIERYKLDIMTSVLADFLTLGHSSRGTQTLGVTKLDLFFQATEGWLDSNASVLNDYGLPRLWELNAFDMDTQPRFAPDMPKRVDLDSLGTFVLNMANAGARLFPDDDLENYLRDVADLPELSEGMLADVQGVEGPAANPNAGMEGGEPPDPKAEDLQKHLAGMLARRMAYTGLLPIKAGKPRRKRR